jgi:tol-pal system protein YbgF
LRNRAGRNDLIREISMQYRFILTGALALTLVAGGPATAEDGGLLPKLGLPKLFGNERQSEVQMAQAGEPRITALEEQVRTLSGRIEELNFQILQMQDQMRQMQEDNELRFQELEEKRSEAGTADGAATAQAPATAAPVPPAAKDRGAEAAAEPTTFGTITFDESGNVKGGSVADPVTAAPAPGQVPADAPAEADSTIVAALPASDDPEEIYRTSYEFILSGDYRTAEAGFRNHIDRFPDDAKAADARYWLGEALLGQKKYRDAAEVFLAASKEFPSARKAPDTLLKLGISLVGLDQRDVACATFAEVGKRYPDMSAALAGRVKQEQALARC